MAERGSRTPEVVEVCPEALAGAHITLMVDGDGVLYCDRCGAPLEVVQASADKIAVEWTAGEKGWRKPGAGEAVYNR